MNLLTIDFETFFDKDYSLTKLTTEEYVRDPRFKVHCMGYKEQNKPPGVCATYPRGLHANTAFIAHHSHFEGLILNHHFAVRPLFWFDTLSMARLVLPHLESHSLDALAKHFGLPAKTVPYNEFKGVRDLPPELYTKLAEGCKHDVELTFQIFKRLLPSVPAEELRVIDATIRMFTEPCLELDRPRMEKYITQLELEKETALASLGVSKADLQSSAKFAAILQNLGVDAPTKHSPSNAEKRIFAFSKTDEAMKQLLEHENGTVAALCAARLGQKNLLGGTRAHRLVGMSRRGKLPVYLKYCGAHTTRWSGGDSLNWQNFTRGSEIRKSIMAPAGHSLVIIDLAQIECRMLNWLAGEEEILTAFREGRDLYAEGATRFYGRSITKENKLERHLGKTLELGCGYGMGWAKFQHTCRGGALGGAPIHLDDVEAQRAVGSYRASHPAVVKLWRTADRVLGTLHAKDWQDYDWGPMRVSKDKIILPNGAALDYSNLTIVEGEYSVKKRAGSSKIYGAKLVENVVQALSRVILSQAMLEVIRSGWRVVLTCHDELVMCVPTEKAQECYDECLDIMKNHPQPWANGLPLDAEGMISERYSK